GDLLAQGDFPGAIAIYETLYRTHPDSLVVANDLASLLSTNSDDPAQIARAALIAAPLHGNGSPAVADTLGWIAYRQGETARALPLLRRAARGLPDDPGVRLRLAEVQAASGQVDAAEASLATALSLAGPEDPRVQATQAVIATRVSVPAQ
ncbi:MAG: tetratricopeptide repeat protein, partial [Pseudomonadota bacterium]